MGTKKKPPHVKNKKFYFLFFLWGGGGGPGGGPEAALRGRREVFSKQNKRAAICRPQTSPIAAERRGYALSTVFMQRVHT